MRFRRLLASAVVSTAIVLLSDSAALAQGTPLFAMLLGGHEVSNTGAANAGDTNAYGGATVIFRGSSTICWAIVLTGLDTPTAAHIHGGRAGTNGGILVTLAPPVNAAGDEFGNPGTSSGCITDASAEFVDTLRSIRTNPSLFYINVHSVAFPGGGVRGQLY